MNVSYFVRNGGAYARIPRPGGLAVKRSLGVGEEGASKICRFIEWCKAAGKLDALHLMANGDVSPVDAHHAWIDNRLDQFIIDVKAPPASEADPDLEPFLAQWEREMQRVKRPSPRERSKYLYQVRTLVEPGLKRSEFTRKTIREWLLDLDVETPNRYRASLSSFARFLVMEEVLEYNPVLSVPAAPENDPRDRHLTPADAEIFVSAFEPPYRGLNALMICCAAEAQAALDMRVEDIDRKERVVRVRGTKTRTRDRKCFVYDRWTPLWAHVEEFLETRPTTPSALVFDGVSYRMMRARLIQTVDTLTEKKLITVQGDGEGYHTHDHRHTWAVQAMRDRVPLMSIAKQLGHRDPNMTLRVYGQYEPKSAADFAAPKILL